MVRWVDSSIQRRPTSDTLAAEKGDCYIPHFGSTLASQNSLPPRPLVGRSSWVDHAVKGGGTLRAVSLQLDRSVLLSYELFGTARPQTWHQEMVVSSDEKTIDLIAASRGGTLGCYVSKTVRRQQPMRNLLRLLLHLMEHLLPVQLLRSMRFRVRKSRFLHRLRRCLLPNLHRDQ